MSVHRKPIQAVALALVGALVLGLAAAAFASPYEPTRHTLEGAEVAISNFLGALEIVRGDGPSFVAEVTLGGKDAEKLEVKSGPIDGRQTLRVLYPGDRIVNPEFGNHTTSTFHVDENGMFHDHDRDGRKVVISGRGPGIQATADIRLEIPPGKRVFVYWGHGNASVSRVDGDISLDGAGMPVSVTGIRGSLQVDVGSGMVRVYNADADVWIDTGSGDVSMTGVHGKSLKVDTGSGQVTGNDLAAETASIDSGAGDIRLARIQAESLSLDTGSGEVTVGLAGDLNMLKIDSGSGDVSVTIPKSLGAQLFVETSGGGIETNLTMETTVRKHDELVGRIGDGRGRIAIETGSGKVSIRQAGL